MISRRFRSSVSQLHFGVFCLYERRYPYVKGCNSGASQKISWKQVVTCLAHIKKHFQTSLAEYWGWWGGGGGGRGVVHDRLSYLKLLLFCAVSIPIQSLNSELITTPCCV